MRSPSILVALLVALTASCAAPTRVTPDHLGTDDAAALAAWDRGWVAIMDEGRWTEAERQFRLAHALDPDWVMGQALVARITTDLAERQALLRQIKTRAQPGHPDVRLLLDVYVGSIREMNARDEGRTLPDRDRAHELEQIEAWCARHPDEAYMQCERIEWIHAVHGPAAALQAMDELPAKVRAVPFLHRYAVRLELELGHLDRARELAAAFERLMDDESAPAVHTVRARMLRAEGRPADALVHAERALSLDAANLTARFQVDELVAELEQAQPGR